MLRGAWLERERPLPSDQYAIASKQISTGPVIFASFETIELEVSRKRLDFPELRWFLLDAILQ